MECLFSYGTLHREDVQLRLFGRLLERSKDVLDGYKLVGIVITDPIFLANEKAKQLTAVASSGDTINGMAFEVSLEELETVDVYEPCSYKRILVELRSGKQAWLYLAAE